MILTFSTFEVEFQRFFIEASPQEIVSSTRWHVFVMVFVIYIVFFRRAKAVFFIVFFRRAKAEYFYRGSVF